MQKILLVVDMQNDFIDPERGALPVPGAPALVSAINGRAASGGYDLVIASQDWHPENHKSFFTEHEGKKPFEAVELRGITQTLWPVHAVAGTWGADFCPALDTRNYQFVIRKGMNQWIDSYSAFFENDKTTATGLAKLIPPDARLDCVGVALDFCLGSSALDAARFCGNVRVLLDCTAGIGENSSAAMLAALKEAGVTLAS